MLLSRGNVYLLGEAYAFGVVWSFALKSLAVLVLRFSEPGPREWRVPLNLRVGGVELPVGLALITLALFAIALINLFTKQLATICGRDLHPRPLRACSSSRSATMRAGAARGGHGGLDQFQLLPAERPGARGGGGAAGQRAGARARLQHAGAPRTGRWRIRTPSATTSSR